MIYLRVKYVRGTHTDNLWSPKVAEPKIEEPVTVQVYAVNWNKLYWQHIDGLAGLTFTT